jgi:hypothetical protein
MPVQAIPTTPKRLRILGDEELVVRTHLQPADLTAFQRLLDDAPGQYALTQLKHEPRDVSVSEIKREIQRGTQLAPPYTLAQRVLPALEISNESITYYASLVHYYSVG